MVNYLYHPPEIERNHEAFASRRLITVAPEINDLLKGGGGSAHGGCAARAAAGWPDDPAAVPRPATRRAGAQCASGARQVD